MDASPAGGAPLPGVAADYFNGRSARPRRVWLQMAGDLLEIRGDEILLQVPRRQVQWPERTRHAARVAHLPDGGSLQARDAAAWDAWLRAAGHRDGWVVRLQQSWRGALVAALVLVATLAAGYRWGLPAATGGVLALTPLSVDEALGSAAFESMDKEWLKPSRLPAARQKQLRRAFERAIAQAWGEQVPPYQLHFRYSSQLGPNAFALPGGTIVMTDQLVRLLDGHDDAILGVLAHELGHVRHRHGMRSVIQVGVMGMVTSLVLGDFSGIVAGAPVVLGQMAYSRDFERQADDDAIAVLQASGRSPAAMVVLFERLAQAHRPGGGLRRTPAPAEDAASGAPTAGRGAGGQEPVPSQPHGEAREPGPDEAHPLGIALSSHPADAERIARFKAAAARSPAAPRP